MHFYIHIRLHIRRFLVHMSLMKLQENRHIEIQKGKEVGPDRPSTYPTRPNQIHKG